MDLLIQILKVSILIPTCDLQGKQIDFLKKSLPIIFNQTYKNFEIIITDNNDKSDTQHFLLNDFEQYYKNTNPQPQDLDLFNVDKIKYINGDFKSIGYCLNQGLNLCTGDLIKILNFDNYFYSSTSLEELVIPFQNNSDLVWLTSAYYHENEKKIGQLNRLHIPKYTDEIVNGENKVGGISCLTIKRLNVLKFNFELSWLLDCDYYIRLKNIYGLPFILEKPIVVNFIHNLSVNTTFDSKIDEHFILLNLVNKFNLKVSKYPYWILKNEFSPDSKKIYDDKLLQYKKNITETFIVIKMIGGLGNQLFMLFNSIALSKKYSKKLFVSYDKDYQQNYLKNRNTYREKPVEYSLFNRISFEDIPNNLNNIITFKELEHKYNPVTLENDNNYYLDGYFNSYKYFWEYKEDIKNYLNLDLNKINLIKSLYENFGKKTLSIHIRLGDYQLLQDYHPICPKEYFIQGLSYYNLDNYQILIFSDSPDKAKQIFLDLNVNFKMANDFYDNNIDQFYMLMLSNVIIGSNSTFSLMSCYFNEMYLFNPDSEYIFPYKWFGHKGPKININDYMLNYKFFAIDYENIEIYQEKKYNVVTTLHIKDKERYEKFLKYNRKFLLESKNFYYVSYNEFNDIDALHIEEDKYPFSKNEVIKYIKDYIPDYRWGWYYQQLLKIFIFKIDIIDTEYVLIFDSDILFLKSISLFNNSKPVLFKRNTGNRQVHEPYLECQKYIFPELNGNQYDSGICHFMLFKKSLIEEMINKIEIIHNKPAWKSILDGVINYVKNIEYNDSILSEFEMYYNYIKEKKVYDYVEDFYYIDQALKLFDINDSKNKKYNMIADHHYQSQNFPNDWKKDNLIEEEINVLKKFKDISPNLFIEFKYNINNIFNKLNFNIADDRIKIAEINKKLNTSIKNNNNIIDLKFKNIKDYILSKNFLDNKISYIDYSKFYIFHNKEAKLRNHILIITKYPENFDEIILNENYVIISDDIKNYIYIKSPNNYLIQDIEYIIRDKNFDNHFPKDSINKYSLDEFLSKKIFLLQVCYPNFKQINFRLKNHYDSWDIDDFWNIKLDEVLMEDFINKNFDYCIKVSYVLIYSITAKTDLFRHLFLYKHSGCYFDLSVKILNIKFLKLLNMYDFITCRDEDHDLLQNGILYFKNRKNDISKLFILEILSGVINYNINANNCCSYFYNLNPSHDPFFYGPITLFNIYDHLKNNVNCKILNTYNYKIENKGKIDIEFESYSIDKDTKETYLQIKYLGYNKDRNNSTKNTHYSLNWRNGKLFFSSWEIFDKILIINLKHRPDRREQILNELNKLNISKNKIEVIEAIYNKNNPALGCTESHLKCTEYAIQNNLKNVLILEDDFILPENLSVLNINIINFFTSNIDWDMLLFNFSEYGPPINIKTNIENIYFNLWSQSAAAYALNNSIFEDRILNLKKSLHLNLGPHDVHWNEHKIRYNCLVIKDTLGDQRPSYSDIEKDNVNYQSPYENILY